MRRASVGETAVPLLLASACGAAALVFELVWARLLMLDLGAGPASLAVASAGTMLGLAAGNELGGRLSDRAGSGLGLFGAFSCAAAATGFLVTAWLETATAPWPVLLAAIAVPNAFLGAILPALAPLCARSDADLRSGIGGLYAANTAGAVLGTLAAGFWLVEHLGLAQSARLAAELCAAAGFLGLILPSPQTAKPAGPAVGGARAQAALIGAGASGFAVMAHEIIDTRFLIHGFHGTTHAFAIILACFIAGLALGAALCAARARGADAPLGELGAVLLAAAVLTLALGPGLARASSAAFLGGESRSWEVQLCAEAFVAAVLLLPAATTMGLAFPLAAAAYVRRARAAASTGRVFLINSLCSAAGALAAGFVLPPVFGLRGSLAAAALLQAGAGAWLVSKETGWSRNRRRAGWGALAAAVLGAILFARPAVIGGPPGNGTLVPSHLSGRESGFRVLCYREGALATTEVVEDRRSGEKILFVDGFVTAGESATSNYMSLMGRLPLLLHPAPKKALVVCMGGGATARAAQATGVALDIVDVNPDVFACAPSFGPENERLLARARVSVEDGRRFLGRDGPAYDAITQEPMPPYFAGTSALYSVEYYRLARRRLSENGILVQWLPLHLTAPRDARQIAAAALKVFPETWIALAPGGETALVVSSPKEIDAARLAEAQRTLGVEFVLGPAAAARYASGVEPVTDDKPSLEYWGVDRVRGEFGTPEALAAFNIAELRKAAR